MGAELQPGDTELAAHTVAERVHQAHHLRLAGVGWSEIAERVGYLNARVANTAVNAYLQKVALERRDDQRREDLGLELGRLDQLQAAYYPAALAGDLAAASFVLKLITRRCAVLGLDQPVEEDTSARTIVIGGPPEEYVAGLQSVYEATVARAGERA